MKKKRWVQLQGTERKKKGQGKGTGREKAKSVSGGEATKKGVSARAGEGGAWVLVSSHLKETGCFFPLMHTQISSPAAV